MVRAHIIGTLAAMQQTREEKIMSAFDELYRGVIETWKDGDSWYRKWNDGWVEQGGYHKNTSTLDTVTLHTPFKTSNYTLVVSDYKTTSVAGGHTTSPFGCEKTTTTFKISQVKNTYEAFWYAAGY